MNKKKQNFKDFLKEVPKPKKLGLDDRLPSIFDTMWDIKTMRDLYRQLVTITPDGIVVTDEIDAKKKRMLAEAGYDVTDLPKNDS